jgi:hypothetical protein
MTGRYRRELSVTLACVYFTISIDTAAWKVASRRLSTTCVKNPWPGGKL